MLGPRRSMAEKVAIAQDTPTQVGQSLPLRGLTSWDETKHAKIAENNTVKVCVSTIDTDVEEGRVTIKVQTNEDKSHYLSGSKLTFLFLCVYQKSITQLIVPTHPSGACFSPFSLVRRTRLSRPVQLHTYIQ